MGSAQPFSTAYRDRVSAQVIQWVAADHRIVASVVVSSRPHFVGTAVLLLSMTGLVVLLEKVLAEVAGQIAPN
jgi:hypothetical protein